MGIIETFRNRITKIGGRFNNVQETRRFGAESNPDVQATPRGMLTNEQGASGSVSFHGIIVEEYNPALIGKKGIQVYDKMRRSDATVNATLEAIFLPILSTERDIECVDINDPKEVEIADFVRENLFNYIDFDAFMGEALLYKAYGFYYFEKVYEIKDGKICLKKLAPRKPSAHLYWRTDDDAVPGITQQLLTYSKTPNPTIPFSKLILFTNKKEGDNYEGVSVLRSSYMSWYFKDVLYRNDIIKQERGAGVLKITLPDGSTEQDRIDAAELGRNFKVSESTFIVQPSPKWAIELLTAGIAGSGQEWKQSVSHHDRQIYVNILAHFLDLGSGAGGSKALSVDQSAFFNMGLRATARYMDEAINNQLIKELVDLNYGPREKYPKLEHMQIGEVDFKNLSATLQALVTAGLTSSTPEMRVWTANTFGLPELNLEDEQAKQDEIDAKAQQAADLQQAQAEAALKAPLIAKPGQPAVKPGQPVAKATQAVKPSPKEQAAGKLKASELSKKKSRELTFAEQRVNFDSIDAFFTESEDQVQKILDGITLTQKAFALALIEKALKANDVQAISQLSLPATNSLKDQLRTIAKDSYETGKSTAAHEIGASIPTTPPVDNRLRNAAVDIGADMRNRTLEQALQMKALSLLKTGIGITAAIHVLSTLFDDLSTKVNENLIAKVVESNVNAGRGLVFDENQSLLYGLQRSEILDEKTCAMCLSLDGRVLAPTDPFTQLSEVHTNCRGIWVGILNTDSELPPVKELPKTIKSKFDMIEGTPETNKFQQPKSVSIPSGSRLQQKVDDKTINNPNL